MEVLLFVFLNFGISLFLVLVSSISSTVIRNKHYSSLSKREAESRHIFVTTSEEVPPGMGRVAAQMVVGQVVFAASSFERFFGFLRSYFGGHISVYESLIDRARREAILRMKKAASGAEHIICVRVVTTNLGRGKVEVDAVGTALYSER